MGKRFGYLLTAAVLLVEIPRFMGAFSGLDDLVFGWPLTAFGTAFALSTGSMYVFHTWWKTKKQRRDWLLVPLGINMVLAGIILIPYGMGRLRGVPVAEVVSGGWAWAWISVVYLSPFVLMGGVTTAVAFQKDVKQDKKKEQKLDTGEQIVNEPEQVIELSQKDAKIVQAYSAHPNATFQLVADITDIPKSTVYNRVKVLERQGIIGGNNEHG